MRNWIYLAQDRDYQEHFLDVELNLRVAKDMGLVMFIETCNNSEAKKPIKKRAFQLTVDDRFACLPGVKDNIATVYKGVDCGQLENPSDITEPWNRI